ncbi:MAG: ComEC family competence protein [Candidatus Wildermuthbacteria bacterium]|nr:ComEC family competence protein [Candidatus Wildermuthbacteria bacterium]
MLCCLAYIASVFVFSLALNKDGPNAFSEAYGKEAVFEGRIVKDPDVKEKNIQLVVRPHEVNAESILVTTERFSEYQYGDVVRIAGSLDKPPVFEDFDYAKYLEVKGIYAVMSYPEIEILKRGEYPHVFSLAYSKILAAKHALREVLFKQLSPPESIILGAMVLGDQSRLTQDMKDALNNTGLRHIIAISGQHVVILAGMLLSFLLGIGLWKKQAILLSAILIALFIILSGAEASAVRAGIMGSILFAGQYMGRQQDSLRLLVFAATLMLMQNPLLLLYDVGFQLSCLAVFGIIVSFGFFQKVLEKVPKTFGLRDMVAMNFAAQVFTLPILIYNFGYVSVVGILTNILVLPTIPLLIGLGFVFLMAGAVFPLLGTILSFPVFFLLAYFDFIMEFFGGLSFSQLVLENVSPVWFLVLYIPLLFFLRRFKSEQGFLFKF